MNVFYMLFVCFRWFVWEADLESTPTTKWTGAPFSPLPGVKDIVPLLIATTKEKKHFNHKWQTFYNINLVGSICCTFKCKHNDRKVLKYEVVVRP